MNILRRQKQVMYALAFLSIINYTLILAVIMFTRNMVSDYTTVVWVYGSGVVVSLISSLVIIRGHLQEDKPFVQTLIKLAVAHVPAVTTFVITLVLIFL